MTESRPIAETEAPTIDGIDTWIFDLDNTLYPASIDLMAQVTRRMGEFIAELLSVDMEAAVDVRSRYFREYGTTLRGLMTLHAIDPDAYLDYVHDIDLSAVIPSPRLASALTRLPGRKIVFTNASLDHAERILSRLQLADHFEAIFDIRAADYQPKPDPRTYARMIASLGIEPRRSAMIEDIARNLGPAADLGMTTVWLRSDTPWACDGGAGHIHHVIDDLAEWLERCRLG